MADNKHNEYEDNWPLFEKFLAYLRYLKIKKYIVGNPKLKCVDIGCGFNGRFLRSISNKIESGYGIDLRANNAEYGNVKIINNSDVDGKLPLPDGSVNRVFMLAVIEHLDMDNDLVFEGSRVLSKDGLFVITTPTIQGKGLLEFLSYKLHMISEESIREHKHYYSEQELRDVLDKNNMDVYCYKKFQFGFNQLIVGKKR